MDNEIQKIYDRLDAGRAMLAALHEASGWLREVRPCTEQCAKAMRQVRAAIAAAEAAGITPKGLTDE